MDKNKEYVNDESMGGITTSGDDEDDWMTEEEIEDHGDEMEADENEMEVENAGETSEEVGKTETKRQVFLPGDRLKKYEELVHDPSAYVMFHEAETVNPCLSFDVIPDDYGKNREAFPLTAFFVGGTQAEKANHNKILVMKVTNLKKTKKTEDESSSSSEDEDDDLDDSDSDKEVKKGPKMNAVLLRHHGTVNRIRCKQEGDKVLCASWSDVGKVTILDLKPHILEVNTKAMNKSLTPEPFKPLHVFAGHQTEGYAVDWSPTQPGVLATGDCRKHIHIWKPVQSGWHVDQKPLVGHKQSVEDIQWSPNEPNVMASCSVDKSIRIWDTRETGAKACKLTLDNAHESDINVISWNKNEPLIISGGDDGIIKIWDLRQFKSDNAVATLKHHFKAVTTVEWNPTESSVFASGGEDDQIAIWDLAAERDPDMNQEDEVKDLPQQLLFIHQGQTEIKELHWHPQITGMIASTANSGFNFFRTISV